jgi:hypothetical protein
MFGLLVQAPERASRYSMPTSQALEAELAGRNKLDIR